MRLKVFCSALILLMLNVIVLYAQPGEPCGGNDDDGTCPSPLDTWVMVLAVVAVFFAAIYLYRKHKSQINHQL